MSALNTTAAARDFAADVEAEHCSTNYDVPKSCIRVVYYVKPNALLPGFTDYNRAG